MRNPRAALHLDLFEQPAQKEFFSVLLGAPGVRVARGLACGSTEIGRRSSGAARAGEGETQGRRQVPRASAPALLLGDAVQLVERLLQAAGLAHRPEPFRILPFRRKDSVVAP